MEADVCTIKLMQRYCDGDQAGFRELYDLVAPKILAYLSSLTRDRPSAEDLLQQTFLKVHHARPAYVRGADPVPWIRTIAHRTFLDHSRRQRRSVVRTARSEDSLPEIVTNVQGEIVDNQPSELLGEGTCAAMLEAVERLPQMQRLALVVTKLQGRTMAQAASLLGTTEGAVKVRAHRAYASLRTMLAEGLAT